MPESLESRESGEEGFKKFKMPLNDWEKAVADWERKDPPEVRAGEGKGESETARRVAVSPRTTPA